MNRLYIIGLDGPARVNGPVKIGCSICPGERLLRYLVWSPVPLTLIGAVPGNFQDEAATHQHFAAERLHHEWFRLTPRLERFIRRLIDERAPLRSLLADFERRAAA